MRNVVKREEDDSPRDGDERLDELLAEARWPEPSEASTQRLRDRWLSLHSRRVAYWPIAAAAAVLIVIGSAIWFGMRPATVQPPTVVVVAPAPGIEKPLPVAPPSALSREPTLRERLVILSSSPTPAKPKPATQPKRKLDPETRFRLAIDAARDDKLDEAMTLLKPLSREDVEARLAELVRDRSDAARRASAVRLLGEVAGEGSFPLLMKLASEPDLAAAAMPAVSRLGGPSALVTLARTSDSDVTRGESARALLARGDRAATDAFLSLVLDAATRDVALSALHDAPDAGVQSLLAALDHHRVDYRQAAAKSLGSVCDHGDLGARLRQMVRDNDNRREALAALVSCPGKPAADFLRGLRGRPSIDSEVRAVQSELADIFRT